MNLALATASFALKTAKLDIAFLLFLLSLMVAGIGWVLIMQSQNGGRTKRFSAGRTISKKTTELYGLDHG